jgi:hypothetical protein
MDYQLLLEKNYQLKKEKGQNEHDRDFRNIAFMLLWRTECIIIYCIYNNYY